MKRKRTHSSRQDQGEPALALLEEALGHMRSQSSTMTLAYYIGTAPFILGLMWFWSDMSRGAFADQRCAMEALSVALLYLWMKTWQGVYASMCRERLILAQPRPWTFKRIREIAGTQALYQPLLLLLFPLSIFPFLMVPTPWLLALGQSLSIAADPSSGRPGRCLRSAWKQATRWPGQNHAIVAILIPIIFLACLNIAILLATLPWLIKTLTGWESHFTLSITSLFNSTYLLAVLGLAYMALDPWIKWTHALRSFHGDAIKTGEDLVVGLHRTLPNDTSSGRHPSTPSLTGTAARLSLWICLATFAGFIHQPLTAAPVPAPAPVPALQPIHTDAAPMASPLVVGPQSVSANRLEADVHHVLQRSEFTWRQPRLLAEEEEPEPSTLRARLRNFFRDLEQFISRAATRIGTTLDRWLRKLFKVPPTPNIPQGTDKIDWAYVVKLLLLISLIPALYFIGRFAYRKWQSRRPSIQPTSALRTESEQPDLADEAVRADALPEEEWLIWAAKLHAEGKTRLAIRAVYLALLAHLARREALRLARHKTNRDYDQEIQRRSRQQPELLEAFRAVVPVFDRVWYGAHSITDQGFQDVQQRVQQVRALPSGGAS